MSPMIAKNKIDWSQRVRRAGELVNRYPDTAEVLDFYRQILEFQQALYAELSTRLSPDLESRVSFRERLDLETAMCKLPELLSLVQESGPTKLAAEAAEISRAPSDQQRQVLLDFLLTTDFDQQKSSSFYPRLLFQPHAEYLAAAAAKSLSGFSGFLCPVCQAKPQLVVLRPEGDGGKRFLVCSFCLTEWEFRRILCPSCREENYQHLPRYSAEDMLPVRVEACDTCKHYLKSVDMTIDGLAAPIVDEIATVPLDLWAVEHGYTKVASNLMGF